MGGKYDHPFAVCPQEDFPVKPFGEELEIEFVGFSGWSVHGDKAAAWVRGAEEVPKGLIDIVAPHGVGVTCAHLCCRRVRLITPFSVGCPLEQCIGCLSFEDGTDSVSPRLWYFDLRHYV